MANLPRTKNALIQAGLPASLVNGVCRYEVAAGQVPGGGFGRPGKSYGELTVGHHINIVLGLSGQPSDAPQAVVKLRCLRNSNEAGPFGNYLERFVTRLSEMNPEAREAHKDHWVHTGASLFLDPVEGVARISYVEQHDATQRKIEFTDPDKAQDLDAFLEGPHRDGVLVWRRQPTEIALVVLIVVAELLAERSRQQGDQPPPEVGGNENPQPKHENAMDPARSMAPVRENRSHANATEDNQPLAATRMSDTLESTEAGIDFQSPFGLRVRHPLLSRKDAVHHAEVVQL